MRLMKSASVVNLSNEGRMTVTFISMSYNKATDHLKTNICSFIQADKKFNNENWSVGTQSVQTRRSFISKHDNENDIANLSQPTKYNKPRAKKWAIQISARRPKFSQNFINKDRRSNSCMSRLAICHASKRKVCIQKI